MSKSVVNPENCKACGLCIASCPKQAISMTDEINTHGYKHVRVDEEKCIGFGICYTICPDAVFTISAQ